MNKIIGIGTDIEEIGRFENIDKSQNSNFLEKIFTENEIEYCYSKENFFQHLSARFCSKEAIIKALDKKVNYLDIEIVNSSNGKPEAKIEKYPSIKVLLSISHSKNNAIAFVICQED